MKSEPLLSPLIIAIDGPSASGKGTVARKLAAHFGFAHLDTGLLYRAAGTMARAAGVAAEEDAALTAFAEKLDMNALIARLDDPALRGDEAAKLASWVAPNQAVRSALLKFQRDFCAAPPEGKAGAVLDGRDIGTVIAPDAKVKIFITASAEARAQRRFKELQERGQKASYDAVLADMKARDARDAQRVLAPTKPASDAVMLDTTDLDAEQAFAEAVRIAEAKRMLCQP
ncbi:MAG: (d)CMP kinase [Alphaproteobacteria bacterium]|nr:(d)CMP kinase [Alphaproteobacteria bacterium]